MRTAAVRTERGDVRGTMEVRCLRGKGQEELLCIIVPGHLPEVLPM